MKAGFYPAHPIVENLCNGFWRFVDPLFYDAPDGRSWMIPRGFETDWGSVPAVVDWIIPRNSTQADPAYALHDLLYRHHSKCRDRADADNILLNALAVCGVSWMRRNTIWLAVRAGGWKAWGK